MSEPLSPQAIEQMDKEVAELVQNFALVGVPVVLIRVYDSVPYIAFPKVIGDIVPDLLRKAADYVEAQRAKRQAMN